MLRFVIREFGGMAERGARDRGGRQAKAAAALRWRCTPHVRETRGERKRQRDRERPRAKSNDNLQSTNLESFG